MSRSIASRAHRVAEAPDPLMRMRGTQHACKTRVRACVLVLVIGCSGGGDSPDASDPPPSTGGSQWCTHMTGSVGCAGGTAFARFDYLGMGAGSHSVCSRPTLSRTHACSAGCAVNGSVVMGA